jgi:hypothetical protein
MHQTTQVGVDVEAEVLVDMEQQAQLVQEELQELLQHKEMLYTVDLSSRVILTQEPERVH